MADLYKKLRGITNLLFQIGKSGPQMKNNSGTIEFKNNGDSAFANVSVLTPTLDDHAATKNYVDTQSIGTDFTRIIRFTINTTAAQSSNDTVPSNSRVLRTRVEITTPYSAGATIEVGNSSGSNIFMTTNDVDPETAGAYEIEDDISSAGTTEDIDVAIGNTPGAGAGVVSIEFVAVPGT